MRDLCGCVHVCACVCARRSHVLVCRWSSTQIDRIFWKSGSCFKGTNQHKRYTLLFYVHSVWITHSLRARFFLSLSRSRSPRLFIHLFGFPDKQITKNGKLYEIKQRKLKIVENFYNIFQLFHLQLMTVGRVQLTLTIPVSICTRIFFPISTKKHSLFHRRPIIWATRLFNGPKS